jgi:hypothetical protein
LQFRYTCYTEDKFVSIDGEVKDYLGIVSSKYFISRLSELPTVVTCISESVRMNGSNLENFKIKISMKFIYFDYHVLEIKFTYQNVVL